MSNNKKRFGILAAVLSLMLVAALAVTAVAAGSISKQDVDALVNTSTDKAQVQSPFTQVAGQVRDSVVGVNNYQRAPNRGQTFGFGYRYFSEGPSQERVLYTGSGVVISPYGHVLTNYHVIKDASKVSITFGSKEAEATVVATDEALDIAVLLVPGVEELKPVALGDSDQLQVGEWAIVIGNPLGQEFDRSVTIGVVSAFNREMSGQGTDAYGRRTQVTNAMIQVDAAINSGNSGGGMFNVLGQLQGIPSAKLDNSRSFFAQTQIDNIGMCLPINAAKPLIREALEQYDEAKVEKSKVTDNGETKDQAANQDPNRPRIGVVVGTLDENISLLRDGTLPRGAFVSKVEAGSPAEAAGLKSGDIIVEAKGTIVTSHQELIEQLSSLKAGDKVEMKYFRAENLYPVLRGEMPISNLGDGAYHDTTVELKVLDNKL